MMAQLNTEDPAGLDHVELVNTFTEFLNNSDSQDVYRERVEQMVESGIYRLMVEMSHLRQYDAELTGRLVRNPVPHIRALEEAIKEFTLREHTDKELRDEKVVFKVGLTGSFGANHVSPRALMSSLLGQIVCLEGIVTKMSIVRPKIKTAVQFCPATKKHHIKAFRDWASLEGLPTGSALKNEDADGNKLEMEYGYSQYQNTQTLTIQEMPERSPLGQLPRSVDVLLEDDLVDSAKPGDRIIIVGLYRARPRGPGNVVFSTRIIANSIQTIGKDVQGLVMTSQDLHNIRGLSKQPDIFQVLSRSLAPSIYGHNYIKQALLLLLLGGKEKNLDNGTHLRGDINILMVGDPSTAKSQLLRFVLGIAPLAVSTTGRGSTGVGLTAAVTTDPETRERRLEAGAMVLADRGVVCIDEFDKMSDPDRVAIHEVMEQQTVTIAKAGIHASLNARCSVVAAANPIYGQYDKDSSPQKNVGLPDSLLSRFDLLFIVLDNLNPEHDRQISDHILRLHRYQRPGQEGVPFSIASGSGFSAMALEEEDDREDMTSSVHEKFNPLLHGGFAASNGQRDELLNPEFIRKYVHYAKSRVHPKLTAEACEFIDQEYAKLRQEQEVKTLPVTARQLESFIRLSTAHAKARLSANVEIVDTEQALKIMRYALYHDTQGQEGAPNGSSAVAEAQNMAALSDSEEELDDESPSNTSGQTKRSTTSKRPRIKRARLTSLDDDSDEDEDQENPAATEPVEVDETSDRFITARDRLAELWDKNRTEELDVTDLANALKSSGLRYSREELDAILERLEARNRVMYRDGRIMRI